MCSLCLVAEHQETMSFLRDETYTVDDAVDAMGFGMFQVKLLAICGLFTVSQTPCHLWPLYSESTSLSSVVSLR